MTDAEKIKLFKSISKQAGLKLDLTESQFKSKEFIEVADRFILNCGKLFGFIENIFKTPEGMQS